MERIPTFELQKCLLQWRDYPKFNTETKLVTPPGAIQVLENLIGSGANLDIVDQRTPCIPYVFWDIDLIRFFLQKGRDINARDYAGNTALHLAASCNKIPVIKFLLQHKADPDSKNKMGHTPLWKSLGVMSEYEKQWFGNPSKGFKMLLDATTELTVVNAEGLTYLHARMRNCFYHFGAAIKQLVNRFPNVDIRASKSCFEKTPLMAACEDDNPDLCRLLIEKNADVNARDLFGRTPLHYVIISHTGSNSKCADILLSSGAEISLIMIDTIYGKFRVSPQFVEKFESKSPDKRLFIDFYEMTGAKNILNDDFREGLDWWKKALIMRETWGYPKTPSTDAQKALFKVKNEIMTKAELESVPLNTQEDVAELYRRALLVLFCISNESCWVLLDSMLCLMDVFLNFTQTKYLIIYEIFPHIIAKMTDQEIESFEHGALTYQFLQYFMIDQFENMGRYKELISSYDHFFLKLVVAPYNGWIRDYGNQVPKLHLRNIIENIISIIKLTISGLMSHGLSIQATKDIVRLDPRDEEGNGLLHWVCQHYDRSHRGMLSVFIALNADVTAENTLGLTPLELLLSKTHCGKWFGGKWFGEETKKVALQLLSKGAHSDCQTIPSLEKLNIKFLDINTTPYLSLQCLSARVLVRSNVNYKAHLPKVLGNFVDKHFYEVL